MQSQIDIVQRSNSKHTFYGSGDDEVESDRHCPEIKQDNILSAKSGSEDDKVGSDRHCPGIKQYNILPVGSAMTRQSQIIDIVQGSNNITYRIL